MLPNFLIWRTEKQYIENPIMILVLPYRNVICIANQIFYGEVLRYKLLYYQEFQLFTKAIKFICLPLSFGNLLIIIFNKWSLLLSGIKTSFIARKFRPAISTKEIFQKRFFFLQKFLICETGYTIHIIMFKTAILPSLH